MARRYRRHTEPTTDLPRQDGVALLEFALLVPLFLAILAAGLEFSRSLGYLQIAASFSREAASQGYRECVGDPAPKSSYCLEELRQKLQSEADEILPGISLLISIYEYDSAADTYTRVGIASTPDSPGSRFSATGGSITGDIDLDVVRNHRIIVIGETYVPFTAIIPRIVGLFNNGSSVFYDVTIM
ncbi:MAG: pilus assembly protein [Bdellovibrionales bacterium]|nr:pilus assembly protein [Bdellovibrionales bacterium]